MIKFKVSSSNRYKISFKVSLLFKDEQIGYFIYTHDDTPSHSTEIKKEFRNKGFGKLLLLKAIWVGNKTKLGFYPDGDFISESQNKVYNSLLTKKLIKGNQFGMQITKKGAKFLKKTIDNSNETV
jgi:hypothetical protein